MRKRLQHSLHKKEASKFSFTPGFSRVIGVPQEGETV